MNREASVVRTVASPCLECQRLQKEVTELKQGVQELKALLRKDKRQASPFGRDQKKANPNKPGRKSGQGPFSCRKASERIEEAIDVPLDMCPHCFGLVAYYFCAYDHQSLSDWLQQKYYPHLKTGGGNKTDSGARVHEILTSVIVTARQQGLNPVTYLPKLAFGATKLPALTDAVPAR